MVYSTLYNLQSDFFKALAHPSRLQIIELLNTSEMGFAELMDRTGLLKSNLSQHLSVLQTAGVIACRKQGQNKYYRISYARISDVISLINEQMKVRIDHHGEMVG